MTALGESPPGGAPQAKAPQADADVLLRVRHLQKFFAIRGGVFNRVLRHVHAIDDVSFSIRRGEVVGLVGESGSGKTTVGRTILRLVDPTGGEIDFAGTDIAHLPTKQLRAFRKRMQIVFQDPYASLNPREKIRTVLTHALAVHNIGTPRDRQERAAALLEKVGLTGDYLDRFPHEFSGGQRQRIGIARALMLDPDILIADESVSALDVSVQEQVLRLLREIQEQLKLGMIFITHDLRIAAQICDQIAVMRQGEVVEMGPPSQIFDAPQHEYTQRLIAAIPGKEWHPEHVIQNLDEESR